MKISSTRFLQVVIVLIGLAALTFLLGEPHLEGRNVQATFFEIYFNDPFLAYAYTASIAFFVALAQTYKLLGYIAQNEVFSGRAVTALCIIKRCALVLIPFVLGAEAYFFFVVRGTDDIAGGVVMGLLMLLGSIIMAAAAGLFEKLLQTAVEIKSENELTV
ncbi:DUF2975 domain-containing protein [Patescibacteria group bacterium]|nr:DUF2975 domain-containing protein [Patescibacteria group bacterium]MBP9709619.1 DUF2975 domain-containing protein [Patescibacteria group bacterium]